MGKKDSFWRSLEKYFWKVVGRSPLPWTRVGLGALIIVLLASLGNVKNGVAGARNTHELVEKAALAGDYELARKLYEESGNGEQVLGADSELENLVYPERVVEKRIAELLQKLEIYPGNREIFRTLSQLYAQIGNEEMSKVYFEKVRALDPNDLD